MKKSAFQQKDAKAGGRRRGKRVVEEIMKITS